MWLVASLVGPAAGSAIACVADAECDDGVACSVGDQCQSGVCVPGGGGDSDGDGICDLDDLCPLDADPAQVDRDADGMGDVCDPVDAELNAVRLTIKQNSIPPDDNSRVKSKGYLFTQPPGDVFDASGGVSLRVLGTSGIDQTFPFTAAECISKRPGKTVCQSATHPWKISFKNFRKSAQVIQYLATIRRIGLAVVPQAPVTLNVRHGVVDRVGAIADCKIGPTSLVCSEF